MTQNLHVGLMAYTLRSLISMSECSNFWYKQETKRKLYDFLYKKEKEKEKKKEENL